MKRAGVVLWALSFVLAFALSLGAQGRGSGGRPTPVRAVGPGPVAMAAHAERDVVQYPSSTAQGYRGVVAADVNMLNDATNIDELVVDFGVDGLWVMEGYSIYYQNTWNQITSINPDWMISAEFTEGEGESVVCDFGGLGLWKWTYDGYPGSWAQLSGVDAESAFAVDDDGDEDQELQVDFGTLGVWRYDDNAGGKAAWNQYSGLNPAFSVSAAGVPPGQGVGVHSFPTAGAWRMWWSGGPQFGQLTGTPIAGNDNASGWFLGSAGEDLVLDFGALGLWLNPDRASGSWNQITTQSTSFVRRIRLGGGATDSFLLVYKDTPGLYAWSYGGGFPGTIVKIDPTSPDVDGACEPLDIDGDWEFPADEEIAVDYDWQGLWIYDSTTSRWARIHDFDPVFMVSGNFWTDGSDTTLVVDFGPYGLWLYDGAYDYWWTLSGYSPDDSYGF